MRLDNTREIMPGHTTTDEVVKEALLQGAMLPDSTIRCRVKKLYAKDPRTVRVGRSVFLPVEMLADIEDVIWPKEEPEILTPEPTDSPIGKYVIMRGKDSGVHAGTLVSLDYATKSCKLKNARRIWYWSGAATLSELAVYGAKNVTECKFSVRVENQDIVNDVCEIIICEPKGQAMIEGVPEWRA